METFRYGTFETNSSSEHTMTYCGDPRTADELPELAENGNLEIEVKHFWHCGGEGCETSDLRDIIHTVKGFSIVNKAEIDVLLELS